MTTNGLTTNGATRTIGEHLSDDQLNRYLDNDLTAEERRVADLHLTACDVCAAQLADLTAVSTLLSSLPEVRTPRSFQLDASLARRSTPFWQRLGTALLPALPAMRAGTIALALAFASVTAYRVADDEPVTGPIPEHGGIQTMPTRTLPVESTATTATQGRAAETVAVETETMMTMQAPGEESDQAEEAGMDADTTSDTFAAEEPSSGPAEPAGDVADDSSAETMMIQADESGDGEAAASPEADPASLEMAQSAPDEASPTAEPTSTATATATATQTATAIPTPLPTIVPAPVAEEGSDDSSWLGWAQLVLGVLMVLLGGVVVGVQRLRRKVTG